MRRKFFIAFVCVVSVAAMWLELHLIGNPTFADNLRLLANVDSPKPILVSFPLMSILSVALCVYCYNHRREISFVLSALLVLTIVALFAISRSI